MKILAKYLGKYWPWEQIPNGCDVNVIKPSNEGFRIFSKRKENFFVFFSKNFRFEPEFSDGILIDRASSSGEVFYSWRQIFPIERKIFLRTSKKSEFLRNSSRFAVAKKDSVVSRFSPSFHDWEDEVSLLNEHFPRAKCFSSRRTHRFPKVEDSLSVKRGRANRSVGNANGPSDLNSLSCIE